MVEYQVISFIFSKVQLYELKNSLFKVNEMAEILPMEENFLLIFRRDNPLESSVDFMRVWKEFDVDCSGYIEADELKEFIKELIIKKTKTTISEEKLIEYADTIVRN